MKALIGSVIVTWVYCSVLSAILFRMRLKPINERQKNKSFILSLLFGTFFFVKPGKLYRLFGGVVGRLASM